MARKPDFYAYSVPNDDRSNKPWRLIGAAWNNNGYIKLSLDAVPTTGNSLVLGPPKDDGAEKDEPPADRQREQGRSRGRSR